MRTVSNLAQYLQPLEEVIRNRFIFALTGGHQINDNERKLLSLPPKFGGLGIRMVMEEAGHEYISSKQLTATLIATILSKMPIGEVKTKNQVRTEKQVRQREKLNAVRNDMNEQQKRLNESNQIMEAYNSITHQREPIRIE